MGCFNVYFTLPPINHLNQWASAHSHIELNGKAGNPGMGGTLLHRGSRTSIENKNKIVIPATVARILFFFFIFGNLALLGLAKNNNSRYFIASYSPHPNAWLSLRVIRI